MHAIVISMTKIHDTDAVVDLLTETDQVIHAYARGFRTSKRFPNGLELFSVYEIDVSAAQGGRFWFNSAESVQPFSGILSDMTCFACASAMLETISVAYADETPMANLFTTVLQAYAAMEAAPELATLIFAWVEARILFVQQIMPDLRLCSGCGKSIEKSAYFQQEQGFLCEACAHGEENLASWAYSAIRRLVSTPFQTVLTSAVRANDGQKRLTVLHEATRLMAHCLRDLSSRKALHAHIMMGETAFDDAEFLAVKG